MAFSILSRIGDILQEDALSNPNSPVAKCSVQGSKMNDNMHQMPWLRLRSRNSLIDQMNKADGKQFASDASNYSAPLTPYNEAKTSSSVTSTPSLNRVWCISKEACIGLSPRNSP